MTTTDPRADRVSKTTAFEVPAQDEVQSVGGRGPFVSSVQWRRPDGGTATWDSRNARKRGYIEVLVDGVVHRIRTRPATAIRLIRVNAVAGVSFAIGGALFTLGAVLAQWSMSSASTIDLVFLCGGFFFSTGGYASIVQEINSPRSIDADGSLAETRWRWWAYEPMRPGWVSAFVLFVGTLAFAISLVDVFLSSLSTKQQDHLIWAPEMIGCVLFLVSGHVAIEEICHGRFRLMPRSLGWWVVAVNQLGSILFFVSGLAAYVRPATDEVINTDIMNWRTALGAFCFSAAGIAQLFERPEKPVKPPAMVGAGRQKGSRKAA
ncbi:MAG TPA: hypothetical protein VIJ00_06835 [Nakamurella sp.]